MAGINSWQINKVAINDAGTPPEPFVPSQFEGICVTFRQNVKDTIAVSEPVIFKQRVGVIFAGVVVTFNQDVHLRASFSSDNVVQFKQEVQYTRTSGNCATLRQWVE